MSRHNRNFNQSPSQRPAYQQVATRPVVAEGESEQDIQKVPSAATTSQSESDALDADPDRHEAQPVVTATDAAPGEVSDVTESGVEESGVRVETDDAGEDFSGFEDIATRSPKHVSAVTAPPPPDRAIQAPVVIHRSAAEQAAHDGEMVPIIPRRTQPRNYVSGQWYNLIKGQEQFVPRVVADHFRDKGLI